MEHLGTVYCDQVVKGLAAIPLAVEASVVTIASSLLLVVWYFS